MSKTKIKFEKLNEIDEVFSEQLEKLVKIIDFESFEILHEFSMPKDPSSICRD